MKFAPLRKKSCDVLIIDETNLETIKSVLPIDATYQVLYLRKYRYIFRELIKSNVFKFIKQCFITGFKKESYIVHMMKSNKPSVVLTFIDNSKMLDVVESNFKGIPTLSVQNGVRLDLAEDRYHINFGNYYCFGNIEKSLLDRGKHSYKQIKPIGSVKLGLFLHGDKIQHMRNDNYICFISQLDSGPIEDINHDIESSKHWYDLAHIKLIKLIDKYAISRGLKIVVAARGTPKSKTFKREVYFYNKYFSSQIILEPRGDQFFSYNLAFNSKVIVNIHSTLGYEMLGAGKKVFFLGNSCTVSNEFWEESYMHMHLPDDLILFSNDIEGSFSKIDFILDLDLSAYKHMIKLMVPFYMNYDNNLPPHFIIKNDIDRLLSSSSV